MANKRILSLIKRIAYRILFCLPAKLSHRAIICGINRGRTVNIVFIISELSMWKLQLLYELLTHDNRYNVSIVLAPFKFYHIDRQKKSIEELKTYFDGKQIKYIDTTNWKNFDLDRILHPDIIFYPQQYADLYSKGIDSSYYWNKLLCYCPYALLIGGDTWYYNTRYFNIAWKVFLPTELHKEQARRIQVSNGKNIVVTGDPNFDYLSLPAIDKWKPQGKEKKRLIWAPHFTIINTEKERRDSFLWLSSAMVEIAGKYEDDIQIAFKPHPHLITELYKHPDWGKVKADEYYQRWNNMTNGQLEAGDYLDLFKTSDALIHDCGSFTADYLFIGKPVMFVSRQFELEFAKLNSFGKEALNASYIGQSVDDVLNFINSVILGDDDSMIDVRKGFAIKYLYTDGNTTVAERIKTEIDSSLFIRKDK